MWTIFLAKLTHLWNKGLFRSIKLGTTQVLRTKYRTLSLGKAILFGISIVEAWDRNMDFGQLVRDSMDIVQIHWIVLEEVGLKIESLSHRLKVFMD
jgi:hypothetical protein